MAGFFYYFLMSAMVFVALLLILVILIQKGRGGGISSAFGGGGGGSSAFGAKTGDVLTWATAVIFGILLVLGVTLDLVVQHEYPSAVTASSRSMPTPILPPQPLPTPITPSPASPITSGTPLPSGVQPTVSPTVTLPTTQSITNTVNQAIQTGSNKATGLINSATQQAAPLLNHK